MAALFFYLSVVMMARSQWIQHYDPALPRKDYLMAIGYYNESIYLLYMLFVYVHYRIEIHRESGVFAF